MLGSLVAGSAVGVIAVVTVRFLVNWRRAGSLQLEEWWARLRSCLCLVDTAQPRGVRSGLGTLGRAPWAKAPAVSERSGIS